MAKEKIRCPWCIKSEMEMHYHDTEWGVPLHDDDKLFEFIVLDSFQAGLSWKTILGRRENFRKAFSNFNAKKIAKYDEAKLQALMQDEGIIRNRLKIYGTVKNAKAFLAVQKEFGSFDKYIWQFTNHETINHQLPNHNNGYTRSPESDAMSKDLKKRGFTFVGTTICYAFMQAAGMINDHMTTCWRYKV